MADRCGECATCIDYELAFLVEMERAINREAHGDMTRYLNAMHVWSDLFGEKGLKA